VKYLLTWLASVVIVGTVLAVGWHWWGYRQVAVRGVRTQGEVTEVVREGHTRAEYTYSVAGRRFAGDGRPGPPNPALRDLQVGQDVVVYYDPISPDFSVLGSPGPIYRSETAGVIVGAVWLSSWVVAAQYVDSRRRRRGAAKRGPERGARL
jgi:hypothetical protein